MSYTSKRQKLFHFEDNEEPIRVKEYREKKFLEIQEHAQSKLKSVLKEFSGTSARFFIASIDMLVLPLQN